MNDDTISRQAAIDAFRKELCKEHVYATPFVSLKGCERILNELPSAEQQEMQSSECKYWDDESNFCALYRSPKIHAQWIIKKDATFPHMVCSECKKPFYGNMDEVWNYCPNCGAKMEHSFHVGQYVLYHNKDKYELGRIVSLQKNCAFICYNEGETAAATSYDSIYPIENEYTIKTTTLGGDRFTEEEDN